MKRKLLSFAMRLLLTLALLRVFVGMQPTAADFADRLLTLSPLSVAALLVSLLILRDAGLLWYSMRVRLVGVGGKSAAHARIRDK